MTRTTLDTAAEITNELELKLNQDARDILTEQGWEAGNIPASVVLILQEATGRERKRLTALEAANLDTDEQYDQFTDILMRRAAPGTDRRVLRAVVEGATPTAQALITAAYLDGEVPDPKAARAVVITARAGMFQAMQQIAENGVNSLSSASSTE